MNKADSVEPNDDKQAWLVTLRRLEKGAWTSMKVNILCCIGIGMILVLCGCHNLSEDEILSRDRDMMDHSNEFIDRPKLLRPAN